MERVVLWTELGNFSVNIALMEDNRPVIGVIAFPTNGQVYFALKGQGAYLREEGKDVELPRFPSEPSREMRIFMNRKIGQSDGGQTFLEGPRGRGIEVTLLDNHPNKVCATADGQACMYLCLGPTSEWDTAAGEVILEETGGRIVELDSTVPGPLVYNKENMGNPYFVALGEGVDEEILEDIIVLRSHN